MDDMLEARAVTLAAAPLIALMRHHGRARQGHDQQGALARIRIGRQAHRTVGFLQGDQHARAFEEFQWEEFSIHPEGSCWHIQDLRL